MSRPFFRRLTLVLPACVVLAGCDPGGTVTPRDPEPARVEIAGALEFTALAQTRTLTAVVRDDRGAVLDVPVTWSVQGGAVVMEAPGRFLSAAPGRVTIFAHAGEVSAQVQVDVRQVPAAIVVAGYSGAESALAGDAVELKAWVQDSTRSRLEGDGRLTGFQWVSSAPEVASVQSTGGDAREELARVTAVAPGQARITFRWNGLEQSFAITVLPRSILEPPATVWTAQAVRKTEVMEVGPDGTVFVTETNPGSWEGPYRRYLHARVSAGWGLQSTAPGRFEVRPAPDGGAAVIDGGAVALYSRTGAALWSRPACGAACAADAAVDADGTAYVLQDSLRAVRPDGGVAWSAPAPGATRVVLSGAGTVVALGATAYGFSRQGAPLWTRALGAPVASVATDPQGTVYVSSRTHPGPGPDQVAALAADGALLWTASGVWGTVTPGGPGALLVAGYDGTVASLSRASGAQQWRTAIPGAGPGVKAHAGPDGRVYVVTCHLYALDGSVGTLAGRSADPFCAREGAAALHGRTLYVMNEIAVVAYTLPAAP